jgi:ribosomal protein S10
MNPAHFANLPAKKNVICIAESSHFEPDTIGSFKLTIDKREISESATHNKVRASEMPRSSAEQSDGKLP